jgi:hypothetical protein
MMKPTPTAALALYAAGLTLAIPTAFMLGFAHAPGDDAHSFAEITVERINIIEPDGTLKLVISNSDRQVEATISGETIPIERVRPAGLIFFNDDGDEIGGIAFGGDQSQGYAGIMFDQFKQDQVIGLSHQEFTTQAGERRTASGLTAWDRPIDMTLIETLERIEVIQAMEDPAEQAAAMEALQDDGGLGAPRMFMGRGSDGDANVFLMDGRGRPRLRLFVNAEGEASIHFLDEAGEVVRAIGPAQED